MNQHPQRRGDRPNVVVILADDMGYSDIGCYGGEIATPHVDQLAARGVRMSQFYNAARCSPSRASLLTGLHPHQTGIGILTVDQRPAGYAGTLNDRCVTIAEVLAQAGYATYMSGKWHLTGALDEPNDAWPTRRGFHRFYGTIAGSGSYWDPYSLKRDETSIAKETCTEGFFYTDAVSAAAADFITEHAEEWPDQPFFCYIAYTAPHWPLHAPEEDIAACKGRYDEGWDVLRRARVRRSVEFGLLDGSWEHSDRDLEVPAWEHAADKEWESRRMEVYAAQVERMDAGIGQIVAALEATGALENTMLLFLSDNGGCAEELPPGWVDELATRRPHLPARTRDGRRVFRGNTPDVMPGPEDTYASYGRAWANLSNTPFREYKHWVHEGGIATPLVVHWPAGNLPANTVQHTPHQLTDIMATVLDVTGAVYPEHVAGHGILPHEGASMVPGWRGEAVQERELYWEHEGNAAVRRGPWKLVRKYPGEWELYDMATDRAEVHDRSSEQPDVVQKLAGAYARWSRRCSVIPRQKLLESLVRP